jgi:hypothetical protein
MRGAFDLGPPRVSDPEAAPAILRRALREVARASDSYGLLLLLVIVDYVVLSVDWARGWPIVTSTVAIGLTALLAFYTSQVRGRLLNLVRIAIIVATVAAVVSAVAGGRFSKGVVFILCALLVATVPIVVLSRILRHDHVTAQTLLGAISVYLLLGLVFAYADFSVQLLGGSAFFAQSGNHNAPDFVYFSVITMTTVGYGDLTPAKGFARTMAEAEALTGQIFLVVLVARLVSMYSPKSRGERIEALREEVGGHGAATHADTDAEK